MLSGSYTPVGAAAIPPFGVVIDRRTGVRLLLSTNVLLQTTWDGYRILKDSGQVGNFSINKEEVMRTFTALLLYTTFSISLSAQLPVPLGSAANFGVLAGSTVTSTGSTIVIGDLGVSPGGADGISARNRPRDHTCG